MFLCESVCQISEPGDETKTCRWSSVSTTHPLDQKGSCPLNLTHYQRFTVTNTRTSSARFWVERVSITDHIIKIKLSAFLDHYWNSWMNCKYGLWGLGVDKLPGLCWALSFLVSKLPSDSCLGKTAPKPLFQFAFCLESQQARDGETREQDSGSCIALCDVVISILPGCSLEWSLVYELYHVTSFLSGVSLPWQFICHSFICPLSYLHAPISLPMQPRPFCSQ